MGRTKQFQRAIVVILVTIVMGMHVAVTPAKAALDSDAYSDLSEVFQYLQHYHLSGVEAEQLKATAIEAMIELLDDQHTEYYTAEQWAEYERSLNQVYVGVGMRLAAQEAGFQVVEVFAHSPAQQSGIMKGDFIVQVDEHAAAGLTLSELVDLILGPEGTEVTLTVRRNDEQLTFQSVRAEISVPQVTSAIFLEGTQHAIGYIRMHSFSDTVDVQFIRALTALHANDIGGLIIDVRGNPGGYLHVVANVAEQFIAEGTLIHTRDRHEISSTHQIYNGRSVEYPIAVLVDGNSASASEILAAALQDYELATIIGQNTYGKGSVQRLIRLSSGSYLKFTMEEYLTPHLHRVDGVGVQPDIEIQDPAAQMFIALHALEAAPIDTVYSSSELTVNGVNVEGFIDVYQEDGKVYVHSRQLAALVGGQIEWHGSTQSVLITSDDTPQRFAQGTQELKLFEGKSYIDLDAFAKKFERFTWSYGDSTLKMSYKQGMMSHE